MESLPLRGGFGIMLHWGASSVPAWAPVENGSFHDILQKYGWTKCFTHSPYAEWYVNNYQTEGTPAFEYHMKHFGKNVTYDDFIREFLSKTMEYNPETWAELIAESGATYCILIMKHMDGALLWPSGIKHPSFPDFTVKEDIPGRLFHALRKKNIRCGIYYSGWFDRLWKPKPILSFKDMFFGGTNSWAYKDYVFSHYKEIIDRYKPDVLWNDIGIPGGQLRKKIFDYYRKSIPHGIVNDRWMKMGWLMQAGMLIPGVPLFAAHMGRNMALNGKGNGISRKRYYNFVTCEYTIPSENSSIAWEMVRSTGLSFGYNKAENEKDQLTPSQAKELINTCHAAGGNLLLNFGIPFDGKFTEYQTFLFKNINTKTQ
jgi:alpha-L-fucosidase